MGRLKDIGKQKAQRKTRVRSTIKGTPERPRLSVSISNKHISAQLIDDLNKKTIAYVTSVGKKAMTGTMTDKASVLGSEMGKKAKTVKVTKVIFDRGSRLYHGRVKAFADAARKEGMEF